MEQITTILKVIELFRMELERLVEHADYLTDEEVVKRSQEIDQLINEYYEMLKKRYPEKS